LKSYVKNGQALVFSAIYIKQMQVPRVVYTNITCHAYHF